MISKNTQGATMKQFTYIIQEPFTKHLQDKDFFVNLDETLHVVTLELVQLEWIAPTPRNAVISKPSATIEITIEDLYLESPDNPSPINQDYINGLLDACCIFALKATQHQKKQNEQ
jgi:hypothetical protein